MNKTNVVSNNNGTGNHKYLKLRGHRHGHALGIAHGHRQGAWTQAWEQAGTWLIRDNNNDNHYTGYSIRDDRQ